MPINDDKIVREVLLHSRTIAIVGASNNPLRDSKRIYNFLKSVGYKVFAVNPNYTHIDTDPCYPSLHAIKEPIDIVDVFRNPDAITGTVDEAICIGVKVLWLQLGVINDKEALRAEASGIKVIMDRCIAIEYNRLIR